MCIFDLLRMHVHCFGANWRQIRAKFEGIRKPCTFSRKFFISTPKACALFPAMGAKPGMNIEKLFFGENVDF